MKKMSVLLKAMLIALMLTAGSAETKAQIQVTVGTQTTNVGWFVGPYSRWYWSQHQQYLVLASELLAAGAVPGDLTGIAFNVATPQTQNSALTEFTIKAKLTTATAVTNPFDITGFTTVYGPTTYYAGNTGWNQHDFSTTIFWDGVSNVLIDQCSYNNNYIGEFASVWCSANPGGMTAPMAYIYQDVNNQCGQTANYGTYPYRPQMRFDLRPAGIQNTFPRSGKIAGLPDSSLLFYNTIYNGSNTTAPANSRPGVTFASIPGFTTSFTYTITGPLPSSNVVYRGLTSTGQTTLTAPTGGGSYFIPNADGVLANPSAPTTPNTTGFMNTAVPPNLGGTYRLTVVATTSKGTTTFQQTTVNDFIIALDRDMSAVGLTRPLSKKQQVYFKAYNIPVTPQFRNVGLQNVLSYKAISEIRSASTNTLIRRDEVIRSVGNGLPPTGLATGQIDEFDMLNFNTVVADSYRVSICSELIDPAPDQQSFNDCFPLASSPAFTFMVRNLVDYETVNILSPQSGIYSGRPATPSALIANNGLAADAIPVILNITQLPNTPIVVNQIVQLEVPNGLFNTSVVTFPSFTPPAAGQYQICIKTAQLGDEVQANDEKCITITVADRLSGDYTIGTNTKPGIQSFPTIQSAVDALYQRGVRGPVRFLLTDAFYTVGNTNLPGQPALDLSSNIIGMNSTNTVTWIADPTTTGLSKSGTVIQLNSGNGIGVNLGQASVPSNTYAVQLEYSSKENANSPGYMTFDGGAQKSLKFLLKTYANRRVVFNVGRRAYNNTIKNCIIELDPSTPEFNFWSTLPGVTIESNAFKFGPDSSGFGGNFNTYTAGIFQRNTPPANEFGNNKEGNDTSIVENNITYNGNKSNRFIGNEIRGFAYGIASIGIGTLKKNSRLTRYYNTGTEIRDNVISKVRRAGIFLGYEDGAKVTGNKIFDLGVVATGKGGEVNGIEVGGQNSLLNLGFNNINCEISRNEISGVVSDVFARGIKVQQSLNDLSSVVPPPGEYLQPSVSESMDIMS
ncbi:MAG: hypothetical protein JST20_05290, partial [Bacteroidetes bacterium]|nr:hypothetical protein [Bacteroidota bacterium]